MKKKFLMFLSVVCFIIPCLFMFSGCSKPATKNEYKVSFYNYDGTELDVVKVKENAAAICPKAEKPSDRYNVYVFDKWLYEDGSDATSDLGKVKKEMAVYAQFNETQPVYDINYYDSDRTTILRTTKAVRGYETPTDPIGENKQNEYFDLEFNRWEDENGNEWAGLENVSENINVYATYNVITQFKPVTITFYDFDKTTILHTQSMMHGDSITRDICNSKVFLEYLGISYNYEIDYWASERGQRVDVLDGFNNQKLYATRHELLKIVGKSNGFKAYAFEQVEGAEEYILTFVEGDIVTDLKIPSEFESMPVTKFSKDINIKGIRTITIPDTVKEIEEYTFCLGNSPNGESNKDLVKVTMGAVETIGSYAFAKCAALSVIDFGSNLKEIKAYAFMRCTALSFIEIPEGVTTIGNSVFMWCDNLYNAIIPESVEYIGSDVFDEVNVLMKTKKCSLSRNTFGIHGSITYADTVEEITFRDNYYTSGAHTQTIIIDSAELANNIPYGLLQYATTVYVKAGIEVSINFEKCQTSDKIGYDKYLGK